jgi:hypothetical protein
MHQPTRNEDLMKTVLLLLAVLATPLSWSQSPQKSASPGQQFDGRWWATVHSEKRAGFINGIADCMTWTAHEMGFNATPEQLMDKITSFYKEHPASADMTVIEVWRR